MNVTTIPAGKVVVGMELVERDGYLLRVTAVVDKGSKVLLLCQAQMSEPTILLRKTQMVRVAA